jgi:predicted ATPase/Tfp pilus assembly protein PilF
VPLAQVEHHSELLPALARALGLAPGGADDTRAQLMAHLRERELLVVLDNMEQLRAAGPALAELIERAPRLTMLATSRERLGLRGEWTLDLGGLALPAGHTAPALDASGASALFLDVARRARGYFLPDEAERRSIARICAALAGHALAIELAASWTHVLSCAEIEGELERSAGLLTGASQDLPERHRTISGVLESTWALLTQPEQQTLRALGVLPAGFDIETAEAVIGDRSSRLATLTTLAGLVNKGLVRRESGGYSAHAFVRQYALGQLRAAGEAAAANARLLGYVRGLVEQAEAHLKTAQEAAWLDRLAASHGSIGAALEWALDTGEAEAAARLCAVLRWFWYIRGYLAEGLRWMQRSVSLARGKVEPSLLGRLLQGAGVLADEAGEYRAAADYYAEGLEIFRAAGDRNGVRIILNSLGALHNAQGRYEEARACFDESLRLSRELGQTFGAASTLNNLGTLGQATGDLQAARQAFTAALEIARQIGYETLTTTVLDNLGDVLLGLGDTPGALAAFSEALALQRSSGDVRGVALSLRGLGVAGLAARELERAEKLLFESLELTWRSPNLRDLTVAIDCVAALLAAQGDGARAAQLCGAASASRERIGAALNAFERAISEGAAAAARSALGEAAFASAWATGRGTPIERAAEELLQR